MSRGEKGTPPFHPVFRGRGRGRLWLDSGDIPGAGHQCIGQGVKGVDPELPPAKGAGRGTALSMVPSSLQLSMISQSPIPFIQIFDGFLPFDQRDYLYIGPSCVILNVRTQIIPCLVALEL